MPLAQQIRLSVTDWIQNRLLRVVGETLDLHAQRLTRLERRMTSAETFAAELNAFTTELGADVNRVAAHVADLVAARDTGNQAAVDAAIANLRPDMDRLQMIGSQLNDVAAGDEPVLPEPLPPADGPVTPAPDAGGDI